MILGFTGTRQSMTDEQRHALPTALPFIPDHVLHGGAVGADTEFDAWLQTMWRVQPSLMNVILHIEIYPSNTARHDYWNWKYDNEKQWLTIHPAMQPLARNFRIAQRCDQLLACPFQKNEQVRGGTWATVRYARKAGKPVTLLLPDGTIRREPAP